MSRVTKWVKLQKAPWKFPTLWLFAVFHTPKKYYTTGRALRDVTSFSRQTGAEGRRARPALMQDEQKAFG